MKKILLIATIGVAGLVSAKNSVKHSSLKTRCVNNEVLKNNGKKTMKLYFPVSFCDNSGCETVEFDSNRYGMNELQVWIDWFLNEER
ncbi:hypothetical protein HZQ90_09285 [Elizabethkingia anophelis]|nr:hypothetical protein [Elizabethkingia anophelis]